ncbi:hypothetical protein AUC68_11405 [Methyloceanibacter methanicus]|uniref:Uncharacterized protein n=2 Tax=Methyloceanibacter methanicus TaxID=1774968 RepID=A0A1E3VX50_9HYPH|nr:hypothetical protein AUC68_11405 [Methyloceanibacter methanicus]
MLAMVLPATAPAMEDHGDVEAEFDESCAMGLADGQMVKTDCSVSWTDEDGKVYCFSSENSKAAFLKDPKGNIARAKTFLQEQQAKAASGAKVFTEADVTPESSK